MLKKLQEIMTAAMAVLLTEPKVAYATTTTDQRPRRYSGNHRAGRQLRI
ncbi:MAG: hypothetical protein ACREGJ_00945 [Candidatus Saccharimonadales bacterium]